MRGRSTTLLISLALALWPDRGVAASEPIGPIAIVQDRVYQVGVFLVVDALVENESSRRLDGAEVSVALYDFFGQLLSAEHTILTPLSLAPGQLAALRVATPFTDAVRKIDYRFTWREDGQLLQEVTRRDVWAIGRATRAE